MIRNLLSEDWMIVTEFDDHPDHFGLLRRRRPVRIQRGSRGSDEYAGACRSPPNSQSRNDGIPQLDAGPAGDAQLHGSGNLTLFFGALNRERDWAPLMPVLNEVAEKAGDRLRLRVVHDQGFFDALHSSHKQFTPTCDHDTY